MRIKRTKHRPVLSKRVLIKAARRGVRIAARETVEAMGFNVIALDGWVVKKYPNGDIEKIKPIESVTRPAKIILE